jgi:hypothetical protein
MSKSRVWNLKAMSVAELRALIAQCNQKERLLKAPHAKARRGWVDLRKRAETELETRESDE